MKSMIIGRCFKIFLKVLIILIGIKILSLAIVGYKYSQQTQTTDSKKSYDLSK